MINIFSKDHEPMSALQIKDLLVKNNILVNKTTIYRELEFLKKQNVIRDVVWGDIARYEAYDPNCHHHIICNNCGKIEPVYINENKIFSSVEKQSNYRLNKHIIEFFGLCSNCK